MLIHYFIPFNELLHRIQDACDKFDGKLFRLGLSKKAVCCNKDCPKCGGNRCGYQKDTSGKKLDRRECCGWAILAHGEKCGSNANYKNVSRTYIVMISATLLQNTTVIKCIQEVNRNKAISFHFVQQLIQCSYPVSEIILFVFYFYINIHLFHVYY